MIIFGKCSADQVSQTKYLNKLWDQLKASPVNEAFPQSCCASQMVTILSGWRIWEAPNSNFPIQWLLGCCFSQLVWLWCCWFRAGEGGMGMRQVKMLTELIVLAEIKPLSLNKHSLDCFKPLINFQSSENIDFDNFSRVLIAFREEHIFEGTHSAFWKCFPPMKSFYWGQT